MPIIREWLAEGKSVRFGPRGTSMLPMLRQGIDSVVISPLPEKLKKYDLPLYQRSNGQYVLHRVIAVGDTYSCVGDNQFNYETGLTHDQMIGIVSRFYRKDKMISVDSIKYRIYCRFCHYTIPMRHIWRRCFSWLRRQFQ